MKIPYVLTWDLSNSNRHKPCDGFIYVLLSPFSLQEEEAAAPWLNKTCDDFISEYSLKYRNADKHAGQIYCLDFGADTMALENDSVVRNHYWKQC